MTDDILLRDVAEADLPIFFEHQRDEAAARLAAFPSRDEAAFYQHWAKLLADDSILKKTIVVEGEVAGNVVSFNSEGRREVGYWMGRKHWGRGVATKALQAFLRVERARPLHAGVARHNAASIRVLEKCGFKLPIRQEDAGPAGDTTHLVLELT